jgi:hypothetical protein
MPETAAEGTHRGPEFEEPIGRETIAEHRRVAAITGASAVVGRTTAREFARAGFDVPIINVAAGLVH